MLHNHRCKATGIEAQLQRAATKSNWDCHCCMRYNSCYIPQSIYLYYYTLKYVSVALCIVQQLLNPNWDHSALLAIVAVRLRGSQRCCQSRTWTNKLYMQQILTHSVYICLYLYTDTLYIYIHLPTLCVCSCVYSHYRPLGLTVASHDLQAPEFSVQLQPINIKRSHSKLRTDRRWSE